jgi:hypothetical protein
MKASGKLTTAPQITAIFFQIIATMLAGPGRGEQVKREKAIFLIDNL